MRGMAVKAKAEPELTPKQEAFCRLYMEGGNAVDAYRRAYDKPEDARDNWLYVEASQMLDHPKISRRLSVMREEMDRLAIYSIRAAMDELEDARKQALGLGQVSAAVSAINSKMKLFGLEKPQKVEHAGKDGKPIETASTVNIIIGAPDA
jgi:phage terminase small subunit